MAKNRKRPQRQKSRYVRSDIRQASHRPEPPHEDRRTKRKRTRNDSERAAIKEYSYDD